MRVTVSHRKPIEKNSSYAELTPWNDRSRSSAPWPGDWNNSLETGTTTADHHGHRPGTNPAPSTSLAEVNPLERVKVTVPDPTVIALVKARERVREKNLVRGQIVPNRHLASLTVTGTRRSNLKNSSRDWKEPENGKYVKNGLAFSAATM